jgi:hypothetical protein
LDLRIVIEDNIRRRLRVVAGMRVGAFAFVFSDGWHDDLCRQRSILHVLGTLNDDELELPWFFHVYGKRARRDLTGSAPGAPRPSLCASGCSLTLVRRGCPCDLLGGKVPDGRRCRAPSHRHGVEREVPEPRYERLPIKHHRNGNEENEGGDDGSRYFAATTICVPPHEAGMRGRPCLLSKKNGKGGPGGKEGLEHRPIAILT